MPSPQCRIVPSDWLRKPLALALVLSLATTASLAQTVPNAGAIRQQIEQPRELPMAPPTGAKPAANEPSTPLGQSIARPANIQPPQAAVQPVQPGAAPQSQGISKLALTVAQLGVLRCVERADQVAKFLGRGVKEVLIMDKPARGMPADMVSATLLVPMDDGNYSTVEINLFPTANGCSANYSATLQMADSCAQSETKFYGNLVFKPLDGTPYRVSMINDNARVLSKKLPTGCLLTKHEVIR